MKEQLKTLKDLSAENMCCQQRLRFEAIKWIKYGEAEWNLKGKDQSFKLFKHFFNITEDDLIINKFVNRKYELKKIKNY